MKALVISVAAALVTTAFSQEKPRSAVAFAKEGKLQEREVRLLILDRLQIGAQKLFEPGSLTVSTDRLNELTDDVYYDVSTAIARKHGNRPPFTVAEVDEALPPKVDAVKPAWQQVTGFTQAYDIKREDGSKVGTLGALKIRRDFSELTKEKLSDAKGAKISFADNHQSGVNGAWNSQGVIYYPMQFQIPLSPNGSVLWDVGLATEWNLAEREAPKTKVTDPGDVQDLTASIPFTFYINPPREPRPRFGPEGEPPDAPLSRTWIVQAKPYVNTDFSLEHEIYGATTSLSYYGPLLGSNIMLGKFSNVTTSNGWAKDNNLRYQLTLDGTVDYSDVQRAGEHTTRGVDDDWLRLGAKAGIDIAFGAEETPFTLGTSYQFFDTVDGKGGYSYLWKSNATWWISPNVGLSFEHQVGVTPISDKDTDQTTLGLEFRY